MRRRRSPKDIKDNDVIIELRDSPRTFVCKLVELDDFGAIVLEIGGNNITTEYFIPLTSIAYIETLKDE